MRLLLLGAILLAFGRVFFNDFVDWDDGALIYGNQNFDPPTLAGLAHHWNPRDHSNVQMYDPLVFTTWWILAHGARLKNADVLGAAMNPEVFHGANLLVHWLAACVVMEILRRLGFKAWPATAGALVFAIHPLQTEPVAWATAMKDLLSGLFVMLAVWRYLVAMERVGREWKIQYGIATFFFLCALLSKPSTVIAPVIIGILDIFVLGRNWRGVVLRLWPWLMLAMGAVWLAKLIQSTGELKPIPLWTRPFIAGDAIAFYLGKLILPIGLAWDYGRTPTMLLTNPAFHHALYWTWIFPAIAALLIWRSRQPRLWAAGLVFLAGVLPVLGLTSFVFQYYSTVADRYVYVAMLGVSIGVAWFMANFANRIVIPVFAAILVALACVSFTQAGVWQNYETFAQRETDLKVGSSLHFLVLGQYKNRQLTILLDQALAAQRRGDLVDARRLTDEAIADGEAALNALHSAIRLNPDDSVTVNFIPSAYEHSVVVLIYLGRLDEAIDMTREEMASQELVPERLRMKPEYLHGQLGMLYGRVGKYQLAIEELKKSLSYKEDPDLKKVLQFIETQQQKSTTVPSTMPASPAH
ncbi:MAG: hypothetical protein M3O30_12840 [Planctomycetota bacterium]|nr:hypothetical protein [Planctomycetota bacterium]